MSLVLYASRHWRTSLASGTRKQCRTRQTERTHGRASTDTIGVAHFPRRKFSRLLTNVGGIERGELRLASCEVVRAFRVLARFNRWGLPSVDPSYPTRCFKDCFGEADGTRSVPATIVPYGIAYCPLPAYLMRPCLASSSQMASGNWSGGLMPTIEELLLPELRGLRPMRDS